MKFVCFGYADEEGWASLTESEVNALMDECFAYDEVLREKGHFAGGEGLQDSRNTVTLRWADGRVTVSKVPYADSKEQIGGILVLEAKDLDEAVALMSKHPGVKVGPFEIRPVEDMSAVMEASRRRRSAGKSN